MKTLGIAGLGLIGGSFAKAYAESDDWRILGYDIDHKITQLAQLSGDIEEELNAGNIGQCDLILIALYPDAAIEFFEANAGRISDQTVVIDCCGTKRKVCEACFRIAGENGLKYLGGHPMAGRHFSGYKYSTEKLFRGAPMVLIPQDRNDIELLEEAKDLLAPAQFGGISVTSPDQHDEMIAFTSQLAHVVSNAYIKSPRAGAHKGFSAGSYKDLTRVAWLNEKMWTPLFMENRDHLIDEIDTIMDHLKEYRDALAECDDERLERILAEGSRKKKETDGI